MHMALNFTNHFCNSFNISSLGSKILCKKNSSGLNKKQNLSQVANYLQVFSAHHFRMQISPLHYSYKQNYYAYGVWFHGVWELYGIYRGIS